MTHQVSIALLTRNAGRGVCRLLDALWNQRSTMSVEIVAVDSGSTDGTIEALTGRVSKLIQIPAESFNHGRTRNLAIENCSGEFVVLIVQDAVPVSDAWLEHLVAPLLADQTIAGAFAGQRPRDDASAMTKHYLERWIAAEDRGRVVSVAGEPEWRALSPHDRFSRCVFDNVCSCIRRTAWEAHPFADTPIAEDVEWARDVLLDGWKIAYVPQAQVVHSHERSALYEYRRTYLLHRRLNELFGLQTIPTRPDLVRSVVSSVAAHLWWSRARPAAWSRAVALGVAWPLGQYRGAGAAVARRPLPRWRPGTV